MLKGVLGVIGVLLVLVLAVFTLQWIASESAEVVVLQSKDAQGQLQETRLWVVDHEDWQYLRVGADGSGWYARLAADPAARVERDGQSHAYTVEPRPELSDAINGLMREKYGWRDAYISALVGERAGSVPLRLVPAD